MLAWKLGCWVRCSGRLATLIMLTKGLLTIAGTLWIGLLVLGTSAEAADPWYIDVSGHWAHPHIYVLWEEEVTDGWVLLQGTMSLFQPGASMTRAQYAVQLAKVFRLTPCFEEVPYEDVPRDLAFLGGKPGYPWIAAAFHRAILPVAPRFHPHDGITRESATYLLVTALSLQHYIDQLSPLEVDLLLHRFRDHQDISEPLRPALAAATKLGIIQGYEDGTLRPQRLMTRAEGVTIISRSCMLLVCVRPSAFSPDGDGIDETTQVSLQTLKNRNITHWSLLVTDKHGAVLHAFNPCPEVPSGPPLELIWDGQAGGQVLPPGDYFIRGWVRDARGMLHWSVPQPVEIREYRLWGHVSPRVNPPGSVASLAIVTNHPAERVMWKEEAQWSDASPRESGHGREWVAVFPVTWDRADGAYVITVRAEFPNGATRETLLSYQVHDDLALLAWLEPKVLPVGKTLRVMAEASQLVTAITVTFPDHTTQAMRFDDGQWATAWPSPNSMPAGPYRVQVAAHAPGRVRETELTFTVSRDPREEIIFIIVD